MISDTHPDAERVQIELIRQASFARRLELTASLTQTALELSRRAIAEAHPELDDFGVKLKWVELHYGSDLANRLRDYLAARPPCCPPTSLPR